LRLLSLVIHSQKNTSLTYLSLADFDLSNQEIRQELIKIIENEYNSIIAQDITDRDSGTRKVQDLINNKYQGMNFALRTSITIFIYSHLEV